MSKNKRNIIITVVVILLIVIGLWVNGIIPEQIAKISATNYLKKNFPKKQYEYVDIEWSSSFGGYSLRFKDENNKIIGFLMNNKYFPISPGQGIFALEEEYREKYENDKENNNNTLSISIKENSLTNEGMILIIKNNSNQIYHYGPEYSLEKYENGEFVTFEPKEILSWNSVLYNIKVDEEKEEVIDWTYGYDKLKDGKYRLVRHFTLEENITSSANVSEEFFVEFEIK